MFLNVKMSSALKSNDVNNKLRNKLVKQSLWIQENTKDLLSLYNIPLDGNGLILNKYNRSNVKNKKHPKKIIFTSLDSINAALSLNDVGVLVSCSHRRAGGGWLSGSMAQEEAISRVSSWAPQASMFKDWYVQDKKLFWLGQEGSLIIEGLLFFNKDFEDLPSPKKIIFAGVAAANKAALSNDLYWDNKFKELRKESLVNNLTNAFFGLHEKKVVNVILCAFGTNVFGWTLKDSIEVLYEASKYAPNNLNLYCAMCNDNKKKESEDLYDLFVKNED